MAHGDYSDCNAKTTSETCVPTCDPGYRVTNPASTVTLNCDSNGDFDGENDLVCTENKCTVYAYPASNGVPIIEPNGGSDDACPVNPFQLSTHTDPECALQCATGYSGTPTTLKCADDALDGANATNAPVCSPNSCSVAGGNLDPTNWTSSGNIDNQVPNSEYSACDSLTTSEECVPTCVEGFETTTAASSTTLVCDANGKFDGSNDLVCTGRRLRFSVWFYM